MTFLLLLVTLTACAASPQDLSGKMFTFPQETNTARVILTPTPIQELRAVTVCHRSFTDLKREHALFSLATQTHTNAFMIQWDETNKEVQPHIGDTKTHYRGQDYKPNTWHSICTTWDSASGLVQLWFDGQPSMRKYISFGAIRGSTMIILGQEQDTHGGGFDLKQCFVGMMSDVHMWDYTLSPCEMQKYVDDLNFTPGNVLNWHAMEFQIIDRVLIEDKLMTCH
ncbi:C-reactive protein-like [Sander lucioperca]|uniref:Pentraxin family member n=1 Tax=Sander lucioperca TaxID=283035 RepID=A0A8C9Y2G7_SANLU|nr:C-reactive protein-like [Sander lucioperca]XP_031154965.1 C-reactive protein-like [Sander lucioperca]